MVFAAGFLLLGVSVVLAVVLTGGSGTVTGGPAVLIGLSMFGGFGLMLLSPVVFGVMLLVSALTRSRSDALPLREGQPLAPDSVQDSFSQPAAPAPTVLPLPDEFSPGAVRNWMSSIAGEPAGGLLPPPGLPPIPESADGSELPPPDPRLRREHRRGDSDSAPALVSDQTLERLSAVGLLVGWFLGALVATGIGAAFWVLLINPWFGPTWFLDPVPATAQVVSVERSPGPDVLCGYEVRYMAGEEEVVSSTHSTSAGNCDIAVGQEYDLVYSQADPSLWREPGIPLTLLVPLGIFGFLGFVLWKGWRQNRAARKWGSYRRL